MKQKSTPLQGLFTAQAVLEGMRDAYQKTNKVGTAKRLEEVLKKLRVAAARMQKLEQKVSSIIVFSICSIFVSACGDGPTTEVAIAEARSQEIVQILEDRALLYDYTPGEKEELRLEIQGQVYDAIFYAK